MQLIYKERNANQITWDRFFVNTKKEIGSVDFAFPRKDDVELEPVTETLYLLDYFIFNIPRGTKKIKFQHVMDAISKDVPEKIQKDIAAVEVFYFLEGPIDLSCMEGDRMFSPVVWVSLLTEKDTGKDLPIIKQREVSRPIGLSDNEWRNIQSHFNLNR